MFSCKIPIRITDLNYGNHVGNDSMLSLLHEARMQWLHSMDLTELDFAGVGLIMSDVSIEFKKELFYGDMLTISVHAEIKSKIAFDIFYTIERYYKDRSEIAVTARTGMICYDYSKKKIASIPSEALGKLQTL
jgi:acyl-CoA thioester hydrolase